VRLTGSGVTRLSERIPAEEVLPYKAINHPIAPNLTAASPAPGFRRARHSSFEDRARCFAVITGRDQMIESKNRFEAI
jgi:hypothetical protein